MKLLIENWRKFLKEEITTEEEAAQWLAKEIAPLIAAADAGNFTKPLAALVQRLNTPDGASPMVRALLGRGDVDDNASDEAISVKMGTTLPASALVPTQGVIDLFKSVGYNGSVAPSLQAVIGGESKAPPILAAGQGGKYYIIDGHHRWSGAAVFNTQCKIPANVIIMDPGKALLVSQLAIAAYLGAGKQLPSAGVKKGRSIIGPGAMSPEQVNQLLLQSVGKVIDKNAGAAFMNKDVIRVVAATGYGQQGIQELRTGEGKGMKLGKRKEKIIRGACAKIADNCGKIKAATAEATADAPPRKIMPQFDPKKGGPDFKQVKDAFATGKLNYQPDFTKAAEE